MRVFNITTKRYHTLKDAERMVYRGEAAFLGEERRAFRLLEKAEQLRLRRELVDERQRWLDDRMIASGRQVVFWDGNDPGGRHRPGEVRS